MRALKQLLAPGLLLAILFVHPCFAQIDAPITTTDPYGNAVPAVGDRRELSPLTFQNETQRLALEAYLTAGMRIDRRGGRSGFALPGDILLMTQPLVTEAAVPQGGVLASMRSAFREYGGFGRRPQRDTAAPISDLLQRRYALVQATSLNAPVHRAMWEAGRRGLAVPATTAEQPTPPPVALEKEPPALGLDDHLRRGVDRSLQEVRIEGWGWFREGAYRRAARQFQLATALEPDDFESRLGELFCYVKVGASRTSLAALEEMNARGGNVFAHDISMTDRFATPDEARDLRIRTQQLSQGNPNEPRAIALDLLARWYLDRREEARRIAESAAGVLAGTVYADWPRHIQAAQASDTETGAEP